jgi:hypothetical protein
MIHQQVLLQMSVSNYANKAKIAQCLRTLKEAEIVG